LLLAAGSMLDADPLTLIDAAAGAGFDGVGLRLTSDADGLVARDADLAAYVERARQQRIAIHDVEVHRIDSTKTDPAPLIEAAATLGAEAVLVVSDLADVHGTERALGAFADRCRSAGVVAAVEYMAWTTPSSPALAVRLAEVTGAQIVVDVLHHHRLGASAAELADVVASGLLAWVQLADGVAGHPADLIDEARHHRLPPGEGELPLVELLDALAGDVTFTVEVQSDQLQRTYPPDERARLLAGAANRLLARCR
jgi:sugar phosphate isomerase/epimerase